MFLLRQSTAVDTKLGPYVDKTDGVTYEAGMAAAMDHATTGVRLSKNGGAFADRAEGTEPVYDAFGYYLVKLDTTDTNTVGRLKMIFGDAAVCLPCEENFQVIEEAVYDALLAASAAGFDANQRVNVGQWLSQAVTLSTGNKPDVNVDEISDDTTAPGNLELMFDGTGYAGGTIKLAVDLVAILGTALTETAGLIAGGFKKFFNVAAPTATCLSLPDAVAGAAGGVFIAGTNAATSVTTALTANVTGNLSGSVGSVSGAVGSVTGAVGSVTGAVGSVTGAVGSVTAGVTLAAGQLTFKKNVARANFPFPMFDSAGALKTGLTVTASIRKDAGASFAALAGSVTEIGTTGFYTVDWAQAETNADAIAFMATATGANPTTFTILTQA